MVEVQAVDGEVGGETSIFVRKVGSYVQISVIVFFGKFFYAFVELQNIVIGTEACLREYGFVKRQYTFYVYCCARKLLVKY